MAIDSPSFAPVVPVEVAACMYGDGCLGRYHLLLAHDVANRPDDYSKVYLAKPYQTIIMDNSVIELGAPVTATTMLRALNAVSQDNELVVVLPDRLLDKQGTLDALRDAEKDWVKEIQEGYPNIKFMAVPQGGDIGEWVACAEDILSYYRPLVDWIGIPRNFREKLGGTRIQACQLIDMLDNQVYMHLLGFSDDLHDDMMTCKLARTFNLMLAGIDSAVPIRMAMRDKQEIKMQNQAHSPRGDWWDNPGDYNELVNYNVTKVRSWIW